MSMMRRLGIVILDAFHFNRFHRGRLALDFLLQAFKQFVLPGHHVAQLLDLMFEMGDMASSFSIRCDISSGMGKILPAHRREVEASLALRCA